jgi:hypothetical protein
MIRITLALCLLVIPIRAYGQGPTTRPASLHDDRRPLIAIHLAAREFVTAANPNGWHRALVSPSTTQPSAFKYNAFADGVIAFAKKVNAQGVIIWDGEGASRYNQLGYEGTPANHAAWVANFAERFRAAGLGVGCTIRHTVIVLDEQKVPYQVEPWDVATALVRKADDAKAKGCGDYLYIDSNSDWRLTRVVDANIIATVHAMRPAPLLIPEHEADGYRACSMPYRETSEGPRKGPAGGEVVALKFGDDKNVTLPPETIQQLREDKAAGSIFLIRGYDSPEARVLKANKLN